MYNVTQFIGSIHNVPPISPYEQWYDEKPDLEKYPMLPFGAIVMAHIPLTKQAVGTPRSELTYAVGTSLLHKKGLKLYNPNTKREIIRGTFKTIGPHVLLLNALHMSSLLMTLLKRYQ